MRNWLALLVAAAGWAQVDMYSEFRRPGSNGNIIAADRTGKPREVLSPAVPRNGYATFFVVVQAPPEKKVSLYLGANPDNAIQSVLYRPTFNAAGIPDRLTKIEPPFFDTLPGGTGVFLIDLFVPPNSLVRRVRYEIQFHDGDHWIIYPLELRLQPATVPQIVPRPGVIAPVEKTSSTTAFETIRGLLCESHKAGKTSPAELSVLSLVRRNATQDLAMARKIERQEGMETVRLGMAQALGAPTARAWCTGPNPADPEAYLRIRDYIVKNTPD